jgi:hypothetical protein
MKMKQFTDLTITLYYETQERAVEAGFYDAVMVDDDVPELGYMATVSFECDGWEAE